MGLERLPVATWTMNDFPLIFLNLGYLEQVAIADGTPASALTTARGRSLLRNQWGRCAAKPGPVEDDVRL